MEVNDNAQQWGLPILQRIVSDSSIVASSNARYYLGNQFFDKKSQYIKMEIPFKSNLKKPACASKGEVLRCKYVH